MPLTIGTRDGLYHARGGDPDAAERVLDAGAARVWRFENASDLFAVADGDCYRSSDGREWTRVDTPDDVRRVHVGLAGELYVGTELPDVFVSRDGGDSWTDLDFPTFGPAHRFWRSEGGLVQTDEHAGHLSSFAYHPAVPERLAVGVEGVGVFVTPDGGETWERRDYGCFRDVHYVRATGPAEYLAATGQGLYRSGDAGRTWARLDTDHTYFGFTFFSTMAVHGGTLVAGAATQAPGAWKGEYGPNGIVLASEDWGESWTREPFPGEPDEHVTALASTSNALLAGTVSQDLDEPGTSPGRVARREHDEWTTIGSVPAAVYSLVVT